MNKVVADKLDWQIFKEWRRAMACGLICAASLFGTSVSGEEMKHDSGSSILHELKRFREMGSALFIAAHPDDENTELLAYLARGRDYRTAYLSLTRGDGGQNLLGSDMGDKLGMARTQELLAARRIDGAQQYFSRAIDFGFSKSYLETLRVWNKHEVLSDMVRVIREFRPDILITRFSPNPGGTHGHHTASAVLAMEAFKLAGDPKAFPEQGLEPWQPERIFWNTSVWQKDKIAPGKILKIEAGGKDPVSGETFMDIAGESRAMHKTQGFDLFKLPGVPGAPRFESFQLLDGSPATKDIMDGVDTTWNREAGGEEIEKSIDKIIADFDMKDVAASVPALLKLRAQVAALPHKNYVIEEKQAKLDRILQACLGLEVRTTVTQPEVVPGEPMSLHHSATLHFAIPDKLQVRWVGVRYPTLKKEVARDVDLHVDKPVSWDAVETLPLGTPMAQPWWLRVEGTPGMSGAEDPKLIGSAENTPTFPIEDIFEIGGQKLVVLDEPVQPYDKSFISNFDRKLDAIPPVSLHFVSDTVLMTPGTSKTVDVQITASRGNATGKIALEAPRDWTVKPAEQAFNLAKVGEQKQFQFTVTAPLRSSTAKIVASAEINNIHYRNQREEVFYKHLPMQILHAPAVVKAVSLTMVTKGHKVGYLPGAGDTLAQNMQQMGYEVKILDEPDLTSDGIRDLDAIVIGVRAFNVRNHIDQAMPILFDYVKNGGTVIVQYNRPDKMKSSKVAPYDIHISGGRVTDEKATMTFLAPEHPVLNIPNKITKEDFDDWVQERGLYFPDQWDSHFTPLLACNDEGEQPLNGALLVADYGKGHWIYTGLGFFRQLPAGVPGAFRLLANMLSIGK